MNSKTVAAHIQERQELELCRITGVRGCAGVSDGRSALRSQSTDMGDCSSSSTTEIYEDKRDDNHDNDEDDAGDGELMLVVVVVVVIVVVTRCVEWEGWWR